VTLTLVTAAAGLGAGVTAVGPPAEPAVARAARTAQAYVLPLAGEPRVVHPFVEPAAAWGAGHRGVDLAAAAGDVVRAPADGTVAFAGTVVDRGVVTIAHPDGSRTSLEPVAPVVAAGVAVTSGQAIGTLQPIPGHCAPAACVHWGVRRGERYVDPLGLLAGAGPVVLLPDR